MDDGDSFVTKVFLFFLFSVGLLGGSTTATAASSSSSSSPTTSKIQDRIRMEPNSDEHGENCYEDQVGQHQSGDNNDEPEEGRFSRAGLNDVVEPIMDASFQDDFDDIHSEYQWFTESG